MLQTDLASAITQMENVNPRYNNPGAIWDPQTNKPRQYTSYEEGYQALLNTINAKIGRGLSLLGFFREYAPNMPGDPVHGSNNPDGYANTVAGWLGIPVDVPLNQIEGGATQVTSSSTGSFTIDSLWPGFNEPNWLILGIGAGAVIWMLTDS